MKKRVRSLFLLALALLTLTACAVADAPSDGPMIPDLPWQQRSDWVNIKTDITPAAKGDGIADDTDALQAAFDAMKPNMSVLYIPAGTYRITRTLVLGKVGIANSAIYGNGRSTKIVWDGPQDESMILDLGYTHSNMIGFVLDGRGKAGTGIQHSATTHFETNNLCRYLAFLNMTGNGVSVGYPMHKTSDKRPEGLETAETVFDNCLFENCFNGMYIGSYNDYDFVFEGCEFRNCIEGIVDNYGCEYIRDCHFEQSRICDIYEHGCHGSAIWRCSSYGSGAFVDFSTPTAPFIMQDCNIDSWTDRRGAVLLNGAPFGISDCIIGAPSTRLVPEDIRSNHAIWSVKIMDKEAQRVVLSDSTYSFEGKTLPLTRSGVLGDSVMGFDCGKVYEIPAGTRSGCLITSAHQSFLRTTVPMSGKVFDAKRDFGAVGDGKADDTEAVQKTIDAAREAGNGAVAYLSTGNYNITKTIEIGGANWSLAGTAVVATQLCWVGAEGGTLVHVSDPDHVSIENMAIGSSWNSKNAEDILQTSTGTKPSFITYDRIYPYNPGYDDKTKHPADYFRRRGLHCKGLTKYDTVLVKYIGGNTHIEDSAAATIFFDVLGGIVVEGKSKDRGGFVGAVTKFSGGEDPCILIKDSNSFVVSDLYMEGTPSNVTVSGNEGDPAGRVTIQGAKYQRGGNWGINPAFTNNNYHGETNIVFDSICDGTEKYLFQGENPLSLLMLGDYVGNPKITVESVANSQLQCLGNEGGDEKIIDFDCPKSMQDTDLTKAGIQAAGAFDDLRRLGEIDLMLNYPDVLKQTTTH